MTQSQSIQYARAQRFRELHTAPQPFIIANAWDGGSAAVLSGMGIPALATSSAACAATLGRLDGQITREEALANARIIVAASGCPVSADLENGFGDDPAIVAQTIRLAAEAGLVGASIEDASGDGAHPVYDLGLAVERIAAAVAAARALPFPFTLTARAENFLHGRADLDDTLRRLEAFQRAGADVLFAPGLPDLAAVRTVCASLDRPVNYMVGMPGQAFTVAELAAAGVRRISLSTSLYRAAMGALAVAVREVQGPGSFGYLQSAMKGSELGAHLRAQEVPVPARRS
ncbi:MAG: isocitrate lyase/phosphoenolpyruvate mutase family protein [Proteobacteria bacterium]|nr:isocitrate lyase/phosphoenolpyruvate mutase family protein [Pseudomonadota bacterium]